MFGTEAGTYPITRHSSTHPDERLAARVIAAMQWWLTQPHEAGPTSALTGHGAIAACERELSQLHEARPALLLPSATYALRSALDVLGVGSADEVIIPALDWTATYDAVLSVGATPIPAAVDPHTLTLSPAAASTARTPRTRAAVVCHLHGVAADMPALREALPDLPIIEDCAAALGSTLDGRPVGTFGDFAVVSFGPGKTIDAGEGGILLTADARLYRTAVARTAHTLRQNLTGLDPDMSLGSLSIRAHFATAILALYELTRWDRSSARSQHRAAAQHLSQIGLSVLGFDTRRENAQRSVALRGSTVDGPMCFGSVSGASNLAAAGGALHSDIEVLRSSISLVSAVDLGPFVRSTDTLDA